MVTPTEIEEAMEERYILSKKYFSEYEHHNNHCIGWTMRNCPTHGPASREWETKRVKLTNIIMGRQEKEG